jgi:hypothetical protein
LKVSDLDQKKEELLRDELKYLRAKEQSLRDDVKHLRAKEENLRESSIHPTNEPSITAHPIAGNIPFPGAARVRVDETVWYSMSEAVQKRVLVLIETREQLAQTKALLDMRSDLDVETAKKLGITVIKVSKDGKVELGVFQVPAVLDIFSSTPKGLLLIG